MLGVALPNNTFALNNDAKLRFQKGKIVMELSKKCQNRELGDGRMGVWAFGGEGLFSCQRPNESCEKFPYSLRLEPNGLHIFTADVI